MLLKAPSNKHQEELMILFIDNYDSFTYILVDMFGQLTSDIKVVRNDKISLEEIEKLKPKGIVISPGPGTPADAGISCDLIKKFASQIPIFGVCLGHQCIGEVFGSNIIRGPEPVHGKTSEIHHDKNGIFKGIPSPFEATRYHSLIIDQKSVPDCLDITAQSNDGIVMAVKHRTYPVTGVQFHPESILTKPGINIIKNWMEEIKNKKKNVK
jgi:anthranilate synthase/aminodeoxychorismate synthase-like glutamine amidotransferase